MNDSDWAAIADTANKIANTVVNATSYIDDKKARRESMAWNEKMYEKQLQANRENWRMMNEYNSPSAQMQRFKDAGLNPHLIYGSGGNSGNASGPSQSSNVLPFTYHQHPQNIIPDMGVILDDTMKLEQLKNIKAERDGIVARTRLTNMDGDLRSLQHISQAIDNAKSNIELRYYQRMLERQLQNTLANINNTDAATESIQENTRGNKLRNDVYEQYGEKAAALNIKNSAMDITVKNANVALARANARLAISNAVDQEFMNQPEMQGYRKTQLKNAINKVYWDIQNSKKDVNLKTFQEYCNEELKRTGFRINDSGSFGAVQRVGYATSNLLESIYHELF